MSELPEDNVADLPPDMVREIASMPDPPEEVFIQYAFFLDGIRAHLGRIAAKNAADAAQSEREAMTSTDPESLGHRVLAAFELTGKLLTDTLVMGVQQLFAQTARTATSRGMGEKSAAQRSASEPGEIDSFISGIRVPTTHATFTIQWHADPSGPVIRLNAFRLDGSLLRPFTVVIADETGQPHDGPLEVTAQDYHATIPPASAGIYFLQISWPPDGKQEIGIEVR